MLYSTLFQPIFDYGCNSWYRDLTCGLKHKLQTAQNKVIRLVLGVHPRYHIGFQHFKKLGWLNIQRRVDFFAAKHMFNIFHGKAPAYLQYANRVSASHHHETRHSSMNFVMPLVRSQEHKGFMFNAIRLWNELPCDVKACKSLTVFKYKTKQFYMARMGALEGGSFATP